MRVTRLSWAGLVRRPVAAVLAVLGVAVAGASGGALERCLAAVTAGIEQVDRDVDAVVGPKSGNLDLYQGALQLQAYTPDVMTGHEFSVAVSLKDDIRPRHLMPIARFGQVQGLPVVGITEAWWARPAPLTAPGLADGRWPTAPGEAVLGAAAAAQLKLQPGDRLAATGELSGPDGQPLWTGELTVVGRVAPLGHAYDRAVLTEMETAREPLRRAGQAGLVPLPDYHPYTHVLVNLDPADSRAREQLFQIVHVRRSEQVAYVAEIQEQLRRYAGVGQALSWAITLLVGLMAVGMVGGLMNERASALRPQLAVLRAQGYHRREVAAVVLLEGLFIVGAGLALGVGLEALVTPPLLAALPLPPGAPPGWTAALHPGLWAALLAAGFLFALPALLDLRPAGVRGNPVPGT